MPLRRIDDLLWEKPFEETPEFNPGWWSGICRSGKYVFFVAHVGTVEVARVELDLAKMIGSTYPTVVNPGEGFVEIMFFEVATRLQRQGIGRAVVAALADRFPGRRFAAFSEEADEFWQSLGWSRHENEEGTRLFRALYVS